MERDENGPYHERDQVPEELFIEYDLFYAHCRTCGWHSDFAGDRDTAISAAWKHDYLMTESGLPEHDIIQMKGILIIERDL